MKRLTYLLTGIIILTESCTSEPMQKEMLVLIPSDWMHQVLTEMNSEATLIDITMPQAHDAGTYVLNTCVGGNPCNTQTQHLDMSAQLEAGVRSFDIRPVWINNAYYTQHVTHCGGYGCQGDLMANMLSQTKAFVDAHSELVILKLSHFCNTSPDDSAFVSLVNNHLGERIYKEPVPESTAFIHRPLKNIIPPSATTGKVLVIYEGVADNAQKRAEGMFSNSILPSDGGWSNKKHFDQLKADQLQRYSNFSNDGSSLFEFSWTLTQDDTLAVECVVTPEVATSIRNLADQANVNLQPSMDELIASGDIGKGRIPNVISVDFAEDFVTTECFKITYLNNH